MTDKELRKLSRTELLRLLIEVTEENERLTAENENLRKKSAASGKAATVTPQNAGLDNVPAARLDEIFRSAEYAAGQFLKEAQDIADNIIAEAEKTSSGNPAPAVAQPVAATPDFSAQDVPPAQTFAPTPAQMPQPQQQSYYGGYGYYQQGMSYPQGTYQGGFPQPMAPGQFYMYQPGMFAQQQQPVAQPAPEVPVQETTEAASFEQDAAPLAQEAKAAETAAESAIEFPKESKGQAAPKAPAPPKSGIETLKGPSDEELREEASYGFEVELVQVFGDGEEDAPQMTLQEELAASRRPDQPMSALERLMIATRREQEQESREKRAEAAVQAARAERERNPYVHTPKGFPYPVPARKKAQEVPEEASDEAVNTDGEAMDVPVQEADDET